MSAADVHQPTETGNRSGVARVVLVLWVSVCALSLLLLFPQGRAPTPRWRPVVAALFQPLRRRVQTARAGPMATAATCTASAAAGLNAGREVGA
jgi:hypothetical protein